MNRNDFISGKTQIDALKENIKLKLIDVNEPNTKKILLVQAIGAKSNDLISIRETFEMLFEDLGVDTKKVAVFLSTDSVRVSEIKFEDKEIGNG